MKQSDIERLKRLDDWQVDRFWQRVDIRSDDECWRWTAYVNLHSPYARLTINGVNISAHRLVYFMATKTLPPVVRHTCDNTICCNPNHLIGGTQLENINDSIERGRFYTKERANYGEKNGRALITWDTVNLLRTHKQLFDFPCTLMEKVFNIPDHIIRRVINFESWVQL